MTQIMREERTEVLIVGAGPVGLFTALLLAQAGIEVSIIDRESRTAARSYACALHGSTLKLLEELGLLESLLQQGRRARTVAFYEGPDRRAELDFSQLAVEYPFLLIVPQDQLETALELQLTNAGVKVRWNHRLNLMTDELEEVIATVEELEGVEAGRTLSHGDAKVKDLFSISAQYIIGTDGHNSAVRQGLGLTSERVAPSEAFATFEFEALEPTEDEVRVVLDSNSTNVLWPLSAGKYRWAFQLGQNAGTGIFPEKERRAVRLVQKVVDDRIREHILHAARQRAPWFTAGVKTVTWCTEVTFQHRLVREFGRNRCWLAGDAAHQTGPVGVQSMNSGFHEGHALGTALKAILREGAPRQNTLAAYNAAQSALWRRLLGVTASLQAGPKALPWTRERLGRLLPCLPGLDTDLKALAGQLGLEPVAR